MRNLLMDWKLEEFQKSIYHWRTEMKKEKQHTLEMFTLNQPTKKFMSLVSMQISIMHTVLSLVTSMLSYKVKSQLNFSCCSQEKVEQ